MAAASYFKTDRAAQLRYADQFLVNEFADTQVREFTTVTGILDPAKRQVRSRPCRLVDEDHSGVNLAREPLATLDVLGYDRSTEAIRRVVCELDCLGFILYS